VRCGIVAPFLVLVASGLCAFKSSAQPAPPYAKVRDKIVVLEVVGRDNNGRDLSAFGTGFIVHPSGYVVTSAHLYDDLVKRGATPATLKTSARVGDLASPPIEADFVESNKHDIALLKLTARVGGYLPVRFLCSSSFSLGDARLFTSGFAYNCHTFDPVAKTCLGGRMQYTQTSGELGATDDSALANTYDVNLSSTYGNSGSPIYLQNGVVVGVVRGAVASSSNRSVFVPITWAEGLLRQIPGLPACVDPKPCINAKLASAGTDKFAVSGGARAAGTGPNFAPITETKPLCYSAPPGYHIEGQVTVRDDGNNDGRGSISPVEYKIGADGTAIAACVDIKAWSEAKPFGAGSWQYATLSGLIARNTTSQSQVATATAECLSGPID
jgi:S1-C subfamily serine protease